MLTQVGGEREDGRVNESALREFVASLSGTQFSCFACTEVQILTQKALSDRRQSFLDIYGGGGGGGSQVKQESNERRRARML